MAVPVNMQRAIVMPHYPHMLAGDTEVWSRFLEDPPFIIKGVIYDYHVGRPVNVGPGADLITKQIAAGLGQKRVDVVMWADGMWWVVEVKPRAGMTALGQVITYARLFKQENLILDVVRPTIVCADYDPDLVDDFEAQGVTVFKV